MNESIYMLRVSECVRESKRETTFCYIFFLCMFCTILTNPYGFYIYIAIYYYYSAKAAVDTSNTYFYTFTSSYCFLCLQCCWGFWFGLAVFCCCRIVDLASMSSYVV